MLSHVCCSAQTAPTTPDPVSHFVVLTKVQPGRCVEVLHSQAAARTQFCTAIEEELTCVDQQVDRDRRLGRVGGVAGRVANIRPGVGHLLSSAVMFVTK